MAKEFKARAKFFTGYGIETLPVRIDDDGTVHVWDSVADHYTTCHALFPRQCARIRKQAAAA